MLSPEITVTAKAEGQVYVKFVVPNGLSGEGREDYLRSVGRFILNVFEKDFLPNIVHLILYSIAFYLP